MKNECNVAKDLMPLVIDGVASEESRQYVGDHIAECTECAVTYGSKKVELPRVNEEKERREMEKAARKIRNRRILRGLLGALLAIAVFLGGKYAWEEIENRRASLQKSVPLEMYDAKVYQTQWGRGMIVLKLRGSEEIKASPAYLYEYAGLFGSDKTTFGVEMKTMVYPDKLTADDVNSAKIWRVIIIGDVLEDGWYNERYVVDNTIQPYDEIYLQCEDERLVVYTKGDEIPFCSPEMEKYVMQYYAGKPSNLTMAEWRVELVKLLDAAPEVQ